MGVDLAVQEIFTKQVEVSSQATTPFRGISSLDARSGRSISPHP
jgi:hypothetical protein